MNGHRLKLSYFFCFMILFQGSSIPIGNNRREKNKKFIVIVYVSDETRRFQAAGERADVKQNPRTRDRRAIASHDTRYDTKIPINETTLFHCNSPHPKHLAIGSGCGSINWQINRRKWKIQFRAQPPTLPGRQRQRSR